MRFADSSSVVGASAALVPTLFLALAVAGCAGEDEIPSRPGDVNRPAVLRLSVTARQDTVVLSWRAVGDDSLSGRAFRYDIRFATSPIAKENWPQAIRIDGLPAPVQVGMVQTHVVTGLAPVTDYWFAGQAVDEEGNRSLLSAVVAVTTWEHAPERVLDWPGDQYYPSWSPDGTKLCFLSDPTSCGCGDQLWVLDRGTGESTMLYEAIRIGSPQWFPDGRRLIFCAPDTSSGLSWDLLTIDAAGGAVTPVRPTPVGSIDCALAPDGGSAAFTSGTEFMGGEDIFRINLATGQVEDLVRGSGSDYNPAWSADHVLAFVSTGGGASLWIKDPFSEAVTKIVGVPGGFLFRPSWSPDGRVVYCWDRSGEGAGVDLWSVHVDTGRPTRLTAHPARDRNPAWSPDGTRIVAASDRDGDYDLYLYDPNPNATPR